MITAPALLTQACERPEPGEVRTIGDLAAFSLRQEAALTACDQRRGALAELIAAQARASETPPRWPFALLGR